MPTLKQAILDKKEALANTVDKPLRELGQRCAAVWPNADELDDILTGAIEDIPHCQLLYAWDIDGIEVSSMVQPDFVDPSWRGRDLSERPYLKNHLPFKGIMLSSVYESIYTPYQCITALQAVSRENQLLGFIAADFNITDLLADGALIIPEVHWQQYRGDPAVRGTVFLQSRVPSILDSHIDEVLDLIFRLFTQHGVFHCKIHFSSGRSSFWLVDDPYNYRIHGVDEIIDPDICLAYPLRSYSDKAIISPIEIKQVLAQFRELRFGDETIYLRSASINIINGMLGLTFSCDGSHYMRVEEFLQKDISFWFGNAISTPIQSA